MLHPLVQMLDDAPLTRPPTEQYCIAHDGVLCYGAPQIETAYDEQPLFGEGLDGRGVTIVIVDSFGAPTIRHDLTVFDRSYGLAAPPKFTVMKYGQVRAYSPDTPTAT
ncbi:MAG TPA: hypothetical protein VMD28_03835, partial [Acidimicrobiales bacterium]|nr:hypothetical protein [Acidimicrobiales bacterium]